MISQGFKLVLYFNEGSKCGWTETYYWTGATSSFNQVIGDLAVFMRLRLPCLAVQAECLGTRIVPWISGNQDLACMLLVGAGASGTGTAPQPGPKLNPPWNSLSVTVYDASRRHRRWVELGGMPLNFINFSPRGVTSPTAPAVVAMTPLLQLLTNGTPSNPRNRCKGTWCIAGDIDDPSLIGQQPITGISPGVPCGAAITTAEPPSWEVDDYVLVGKVQGCTAKGINGPTPVLSITGNVTTVARHPCCCPPWTFTPGRGLISQAIPALWPMQSAVIGGTTKREIGRPFVPMTWAPVEEEVLACHPCGVIMDFQRAGYHVLMQTWFVGGDPTPVVWFKAPPTAIVYQAPTVFRSRNYIDPYHTYSGVGENPVACWQGCRGPAKWYCREWYPYDNPPAPYQGKHPCPDDSDLWRYGGIPS